MSALTLIPVPYRDYKQATAVIADFNAGKDFHVCDMSSAHDGRACTRAELEQAGVREVRIRFNRLTKVTVIKLGGAS